jgi:hypothetical protein
VFELRQGTLTERKVLSTVDLLIRVACFVIKGIKFSIEEAGDLNRLVQPNVAAPLKLVIKDGPIL